MPDPIQTLQTDIAKARLAVDKSQARLARLNEDRRLADATLIAATARGDTAAALLAERASINATEKITAATVLGDQLDRTFLDI